MRFVILGLMLLLPASVPLAAPNTGTITGKVIVTRDGKKASREFVFAYLERTQKKRLKPKPTSTSIAQKGQVFHPRVRVIPSRSRVDFPNQEKSEEHNVFSPTKPHFDLKRFGPGESAGQTFDFPDEYDIYCDIHSNMTAKVKVVDSDHIARVENGTFTFKDVPAGTYKLHIWTPNANEVGESVTVVAGQTTTLPHEIKLPLKPLSSATHVRKDGTPYPACKYSTVQSCRPTDDVW